MPVTVSSSAALSSALASAKAGDTILVAPGNYALTAQNLSYSSNVTVASANPNDPAVFTTFSVTRISNVTFDNLEFFMDGTRGAFLVSRGANIRFDHLDMHGSLDNNPLNDLGGILIRDSSNVTVTNSEFHELGMALGHLNNTGLTISNNTFHDIKLDGIRGGGSSVVKISGNTFRDFYPVNGDHPDAIQFWTTNVTTLTQDITIIGNIFLRGVSTKTAQGIFLNDESGAGYRDVTISGNFVAGAGYNGIAVFGAQNVTVTDNDVVGFTDMKSWIRLERVTGGVVEDNQANTYITGGNTGLLMADNTTIAQVADGGLVAYAAWRAEHGLDAPPTPGIVGTALGDTLNGTAEGDSIDGGAGSDKLHGLGGADTLVGGDGNDALVGGAGVDRLEGGAGDDLYFIDSLAEQVVELAGGGLDKVQSGLSYTLGAQVERLALLGSENLTGTGNELANGLQGNAGDNLLKGLAGADNLSGAGGADTLVGGTDADTLVGGAGVDVFLFARGDGRDTISDFGLGGEHDVIDVSAFIAASLKPTLTQGAAGVTIAYASGESILVKGALLANLHTTAIGWVF